MSNVKLRPATRLHRCTRLLPARNGLAPRSACLFANGELSHQSSAHGCTHHLRRDVSSPENLSEMRTQQACFANERDFENAKECALINFAPLHVSTMRSNLRHTSLDAMR